jgi:hypothetical protein
LHLPPKAPRPAFMSDEAGVREGYGKGEY